MEEKQARKSTPSLVLYQLIRVDRSDKTALSSTFHHPIRSRHCVSAQIALCLYVLSAASLMRGSPFVYGANGRQLRQRNTSRQTCQGHAG
jgi:hypothetical protein